MHLRRFTALTLGLAAALLLSGCGFNYATDRVYTPAMGANNRDGSVDVLGAVIVSGEPGSGTFVASLANNDRSQSASLESLTGGEGTDLTAADFPAVRIDAGDLVSLASEGGLVVTGSFAAGDFVPVTLTFGDGDVISLQVPVVRDEGYFAGLDSSGQPTSGTPSAEPSLSMPVPSESPTATPTP